MTPSPIDLAAIRSLPHFRLHLTIVSAYLLGLVALFSLVHASVHLPFDVSLHPQTGLLQAKGTDSEAFEEVQKGDVILAVNGSQVDSKTEFWHAIRQAEGEAEILLRRTDLTFQRNLTPASFAAGDIPAGVKADDRPIGMACQSDTTFVELAAVDFEALRHLVFERAGESGLMVYFERPHEELLLLVPLQAAPQHWPVAALALIGLFLILLTLWLAAARGDADSNDLRPLYLNALILLTFLAIVPLALGAPLLSSPLLLGLCAVGLAFVKAVDLEMHVRQRAAWAKLEWFLRVALYTVPAVVCIQILYYSIIHLSLWWGADISPESEARLDTLLLLLHLVVIAYIVADAVITVVRHRIRGADPQLAINGANVGLGFSTLFALSALYLYFSTNDIKSAAIILIAALVAQLVGNLAMLFELPRPFWKNQENLVLSTTPTSQLLLRLSRLLPGLDVAFVVDRPPPYPAVHIQATEKGDLNFKPLSKEWQDFLDVLRTEGGMVPRAANPDDTDPVPGMAEGLGICLAWPLIDAAGGSLSALTLTATTQDLERDPQEVASLVYAAFPEIKARLAQIHDLAPSLVYLSAVAFMDRREGRGDVPGDLATAAPTTAPEAKGHEAAPTPTPPAAVTPAPAAPRPQTTPHETEASEEYWRLQARLRAVESEVHRLYPVDDVELPRAQQEALDDLSALGAPALLLGEAGVGKRVIATLAHQRLGGGPFVILDAAEMPEAVLELELFGTDDAPGRLTAAMGGTLFIEGADRLPASLVESLFDAVEQSPDDDMVRVFMAVDTDPDAIDFESGHVPPRFQPLIDQSAAEVVLVPPVRAQDDSGAVADFFLLRAAMRYNKAITSFSEEALHAIAAYPWPGNYDEMQAVISRAVLVCGEAEQLDMANLRTNLDHDPENEADDAGLDELRARIDDFEALHERDQAQIARLHQELDALRPTEGGGGVHSLPQGDAQHLLAGTFAEVEARLLAFALEDAGGNKSQAARALGLSRTVFINKLNKHNLS